MMKLETHGIMQQSFHGNAWSSVVVVTTLQALLKDLMRRGNIS